MTKTITGKHIQYGFKTPVIKIDQHIFGQVLSDEVINPSGQYDNAKPVYEAQADNFETQGCTDWGTENAIEFLHKFKFGEEKNYEELPVYIGASIRPESGGDPHTVAQWIRDNGLVEAPRFPFPKTLNELLALLGKPLPQNIVDLGENWLTTHSFRHQWVLQGYESKEQRIDAIKSALPYGVLGVSVTAWFQNKDGVYVDNGLPNSHWCVCYGWTDKGWKIFDSYSHEEKIYSFDSKINFAKLYFLDKKPLTTETKPKSWWFLEILKNLAKVLGLMKEEIKNLPVQPQPLPVTTEQTPSELLKKYCLESLGKDLSDFAPNELGCADSLSYILKRIFPDFPSLVSTITLRLHLDLDKRFKRTLTEANWLLIISPTDEQTKQVGHCGILGENGIIYSNNSSTGLWDKHWTLPKWVDYYRVKKGLKLYFYELIG